MSVHATRRAFAALTYSGAVHVWGNTFQGGSAFDVASYLTANVTAVCANEAAFTAVRSDGMVVMWGHMTVIGEETGGRVVFSGEPGYSAITACA